MTEQQDDLDHALINAVESGDMEESERLLLKGANVDTRRNYKNIPLPPILAAKEWDNKGPTPLIIAASYGELDIIELLLDYGADPNLQDNWGNTALMNNAQDVAEDTYITQFLLDHGADPNIKNMVGDTALMYAAWKGYIEIMDLLVNTGADPDIKNDAGQTALDILKKRRPDKYSIWANTIVVAEKQR